MTFKKERKRGPCMRYNHGSYREWEDSEKKKVEKMWNESSIDIFHPAYASGILACLSVCFKNQPQSRRGFEKNSDI